MKSRPNFEQPVFSSEINFGSFLYSTFILSIIVYILKFYIDVLILLLFYSIALYCLSAFLITKFIFFNDKFIVYRPLSLFRKIKTILYEEIRFIKFMNKAGKYQQPLIIFNLKGKKDIRFCNPTNSFACRNYENRKKVLNFLKEKDLNIVINSDLEKDLKLLD